MNRKKVIDVLSAILEDADSAYADESFCSLCGRYMFRQGHDPDCNIARARELLKELEDESLSK